MTAAPPACASRQVRPNGSRHTDGASAIAAASLSALTSAKGAPTSPGRARGPVDAGASAALDKAGKIIGETAWLGDDEGGRRPIGVTRQNAGERPRRFQQALLWRSAANDERHLFALLARAPGGDVDAIGNDAARRRHVWPVALEIGEHRLTDKGQAIERVELPRAPPTGSGAQPGEPARGPQEVVLLQDDRKRRARLDGGRRGHVLLNDHQRGLKRARESRDETRASQRLRHREPWQLVDRRRRQSAFARFGDDLDAEAAVRRQLADEQIDGSRRGPRIAHATRQNLQDPPRLVAQFRALERSQSPKLHAPVRRRSSRQKTPRLRRES